MIVVMLALVTVAVNAADFYVTPDGNDANPGTQAKPFATLYQARDAARTAGSGHHRIMVISGDYFLTRPLELDARDNGLTIEAAEPGRATLYGGRLVGGWRRDGGQFWCVDLPGVKDGGWNFRALIVNGRMPDRARMPETGTFLHRSRFDVKVLPATEGYWARQPTLLERTTLEYDPKDIPPTFDIRNAEVRVYHMWDESIVGLATNDLLLHTFTFSSPARWPSGAFGIKKYVVFNTREGMTKPGQWYLDRTAGKLVYWPLPDEDMTKVRVVAPLMEHIIHIVGTSKLPVRNVTLRGLALQSTTTPLRLGQFGAMSFDGALDLEQARQCVVEKLTISNVGGTGIHARSLVDCQICDCQVHQIGAGGVFAAGSATLVASNHIHHVGLNYPSAAGLYFSGNRGSRTDGRHGFHIYRNEVNDAPYSGIIGAGTDNVIDENLVYRVMREMQDGGGIYGNLINSTIRGNVVRDVVSFGEGYGVSSYYLDERSTDCVVERNQSVGVERPAKCHVARNINFRDNVFIAEAGMSLSFPRSSDCTFVGNTLTAPGKISVDKPDAITVWSNNLVVRESGGVPQLFALPSAGH